MTKTVGENLPFFIRKIIWGGGVLLGIFRVYNEGEYVKGGFFLSCADLKKIKAEYIAGGVTLEELAEKHDFPYGTLTKKCAEGKWTDLRKEVERKAEKKAIEKISEKEAKINERYYSLVDKLFDKLEAVIDETPVWTSTGLKDCAAVAKILKDCKDIKSDADRREQEARINKLRKEAQTDAPEDKPVNVIFSGDVEEYSK